MELRASFETKDDMQDRNVIHPARNDRRSRIISQDSLETHNQFRDPETGVL